LLGVQAVVTKSFERIHRSNLIGIGVLPLNFKNADDYERLALDGSETFDILGLSDEVKPMQEATLVVHRADGSSEEVALVLRLDTPIEVEYYRAGGILSYGLQEILRGTR
jgi:aconitate hydratase